MVIANVAYPRGRTRTSQTRIFRRRVLWPALESRGAFGPIELRENGCAKRMDRFEASPRNLLMEELFLLECFQHLELEVEAGAAYVVLPASLAAARCEEIPTRALRGRHAGTPTLCKRTRTRRAGIETLHGQRRPRHRHRSAPALARGSFRVESDDSGIALRLRLRELGHFYQRFKTKVQAFPAALPGLRPKVTGGPSNRSA